MKLMRSSIEEERSNMLSRYIYEEIRTNVNLMKQFFNHLKPCIYG